MKMLGSSSKLKITNSEWAKFCLPAAGAAGGRFKKEANMFRLCVSILGMFVIFAQLAFAQSTDKQNTSSTQVSGSQPGPILQREVNQQERIAQGVRSGELTAGETARLERDEAKIEKDRERSWADGNLSPQEKARLNREENKESALIYKLKHNEVETQGKPGPILQREVNQQERIAQGVRSGELTAGETARLERDEAKIEKDRERSWADGNLSPQEKARLNREQNRESAKIYDYKHNDSRGHNIAQGGSHNAPVRRRR